MLTMLNSLKAYGRFSTDPAIRRAAAPEDFVGAINNEDRSIQRSLVWMPKGSFDSFSAGSGSDFKLSSNAGVDTNSEMGFYGGKWD